jgi:acylphosphatase
VSHVPQTALRLIVEGRVQGVGFRMFVSDAARSRDLRGWVRNRRDGSVEALLIGDEGAVAAVAAQCRKGPRLAQVTKVTEEPAVDDGAAGFAERPTV